MADPRSPTRTPGRRHVPTGDLLETGPRGCGNPASRDDTRVTQLPSGALSWAGEDWSHVLDPYWCGSHLWHPIHEQPCRKTPTRETHVRGSAGPPGSISAPMEAGQGIAGRTQVTALMKQRQKVWRLVEQSMASHCASQTRVSYSGCAGTRCLWAGGGPATDTATRPG